MREQAGGRVAYQATGFSSVFATGWLQAGFFSFAYRLAHLRLSRTSVLGVMFLLFYFS